MTPAELLLELSDQAHEPAETREPGPGAFAALRSGDRACWERFLRRMERRCLALAWRMLNDPHLAADSVQEGFLKAYLNRSSMREDGREEQWLLSIVANTARDAARSAKRRPEQTDAELITRSAVEPVPEVLLEEKLRLALAALDEVSRVCFLLVHQEGFTYEQVAVEFGWPLGTVRSRLHRARLRLRELLKQEGGHGR